MHVFIADHEAVFEQGCKFRVRILRDKELAKFRFGESGNTGRPPHIVLSCGMVCFHRIGRVEVPNAVSGLLLFKGSSEKLQSPFWKRGVWVPSYGPKLIDP